MLRFVLKLSRFNKTLSPHINILPRQQNENLAYKRENTITNQMKSLKKSNTLVSFCGFKPKSALKMTYGQL